MAEFQFLLTEQDDSGTLTITINRPEKLNALNRDTIKEIDKAFDLAKDNDNVKGIILTGSGEKAFVAGADIKEIAILDKEQATILAKDGQNTFTKIENYTKPVIAAVNGYALGGGCELAMACHFRIATKNAMFGQPEVNLGLIPGYGGTQRLPQLIGKGKAMELLMTADLIDAQDAFRLGLINHVVDDNKQLHELAHNLLKKISKKAPLAIAKVVHSVNIGYSNPEEGYNVEADNFGKCVKTEDFKEGTKAFIEKRPANFKGK